MIRFEKWHSVNNASSIFTIIDTDLCRMRDKYANSLPDFHTSSSLIVASDYSGENDKSPYQILSFLFAGINDCLAWNKNRKDFREKHFPNNRRMAFKNLNDYQRQKALIPFLETANQLPGLLFTIAIDNSINTLFNGNAPLDLDNPDFQEFQTWKPKVLEKAFRIMHLAAFLTAGLSSPSQNVLWVSDEDSIAANFSRLTQLTNVFAYILSNYLKHDLTHIRCGTTNNDDGSLLIEDLTSIPDLVAGAISEQLIISEDEPEFEDIFWVMRPGYTSKTNSITWWLSNENHPLKRYFCMIKPLKESTALNVSWFHFYNQS